MTQYQLDRSVARTTGESLRTIRALGFALLAAPPVAMGPVDLHLAVACPRCGVDQTLACDRDGTAAMGECAPCDLLFDYLPSDVRVVDSDDGGVEGRD